VVRVVVLALLVFAAAVEARRWVHHAQLELVPVIVAPGADAAAILNPPPGAVWRRMTLDVSDALHPPQRARLAVLTFDDGPFPVSSPALLATLRALGVPADFFVIGDDARSQPDIAARMAAVPMEIANHSLTHPQMPTLVFAAQLEEIADGAAAIREATGRQSVYFRPPHGNYNALTLQAAHAAGEIVALWDVDPGDWRTLSPDEIRARVIGHARSPAVILLHNGKDATIEALPGIVGAYRRAGFTFTTLSALQRRLPLEAINDPLRVTIR